jgi:RimJ/RimL family protein N-acetyltransferase
MIRTERLILRPWQDSDLPLFAAQNADPVVMRFLNGPLTRAQSDAYAARAIAHLAEHGFGKWAVEAPGVARFIGAVGLQHVRFEADFAPAVEVAWRLNRSYWGQGYATEAARAAIADGFQRVGLREIVAITAVQNEASRRVMQRLEMQYMSDFDHPLVAPESPLRRHALYRLAAAE